MAKISEIKYGRKFNLGNYESEEIALTAVVDEDDDAAEVLADLKTKVAEANADGSIASTKTTEPEEEEENGSTDDDTETDDDSDSKNDDDGSENEDDDQGSEGDEETEDEDGDKKPPKKTGGAKGKPKAGTKGKDKTVGGKKVKPKAEVYDRENGTHKDIFSNVLTSVDPNWKKSDKTKLKAKKVSEQLEGEAFLDKDGEVVSAFKQSVKKAMAKK